jgi:hypothetical protein
LLLLPKVNYVHNVISEQFQIQFLKVFPSFAEHESFPRFIYIWNGMVRSIYLLMVAIKEGRKDFYFALSGDINANFIQKQERDFSKTVRVKVGSLSHFSSLLH